MTDGVLSDIVNPGVDPDQHLLQSGPADSETWINWMHRTTKKKKKKKKKKKTHETISQLWEWLCQAYSVLAKHPIGSYTLE